MTHTLVYNGGDGLLAELTLSRRCGCTNFGAQQASPSPVCQKCQGKGELLTENGKAILRFMRDFEGVQA